MVKSFVAFSTPVHIWVDEEITRVSPPFVQNFERPFSVPNQISLLEFITIWLILLLKIGEFCVVLDLNK
jgi:hypothetical protein